MKTASKGVWNTEAAYQDLLILLENSVNKPEHSQDAIGSGKSILPEDFAACTTRDYSSKDVRTNILHTYLGDGKRTRAHNAPLPDPSAGVSPQTQSTTTTTAAPDENAPKEPATQRYIRLRYSLDDPSDAQNPGLRSLFARQVLAATQFLWFQASVNTERFWASADAYLPWLSEGVRWELTPDQRPTEPTKYGIQAPENDHVLRDQATQLLADFDAARLNMLVQATPKPRFSDMYRLLGALEDLAASLPPDAHHSELRMMYRSGRQALGAHTPAAFASQLLAKASAEYSGGSRDTPSPEVVLTGAYRDASRIDAYTWPALAMSPEGYSVRLLRDGIDSASLRLEEVNALPWTLKCTHVSDIKTCAFSEEGDLFTFAPSAGEGCARVAKFPGVAKRLAEKSLFSGLEAPLEASDEITLEAAKGPARLQAWAISHSHMYFTNGTARLKRPLSAGIAEASEKYSAPDGVPTTHPGPLALCLDAQSQVTCLPEGELHESGEDKKYLLMRWSALEAELWVSQVKSAEGENDERYRFFLRNGNGEHRALGEPETIPDGNPERRVGLIPASDCYRAGEHLLVPHANQLIALVLPKDPEGHTPQIVREHDRDSSDRMFEVLTYRDQKFGHTTYTTQCLNLSFDPAGSEPYPATLSPARPEAWRPRADGSVDIGAGVGLRLSALARGVYTFAELTHFQRALAPTSARTKGLDTEGKRVPFRGLQSGDFMPIRLPAPEGTKPTSFVVRHGQGFHILEPGLRPSYAPEQGEFSAMALIEKTIEPSLVLSAFYRNMDAEQSLPEGMQAYAGWRVKHWDIITEEACPPGTMYLGEPYPGRSS